jgi:hypothetical protein
MKETHQTRNSTGACVGEVLPVTILYLYQIIQKNGIRCSTTEGEETPLIDRSNSIYLRRQDEMLFK